MPTLWPFFPETVIEAVTSLTDRLMGYSTSQRIALNAEPMQGLAFEWGPTEVEAGAAEALVRSNALGDWYVPFWPEALVAGALSAAATTISVDAANRDYRDGGFVAVLDDWGTAEVVALTSVGSGVLNLGAGLANSYSNAWVVPVLTGHAPGGLTISRNDTRLLTGKISFRIRDVADLGASTYDTFGGDPVLHDRSYMTDTIETLTAQRSALIGTGLGQVSSEPLVDYIQSASAVRFEDAGAAARYARRQWIWYLRGGQRAFWLPTWNPDLTLASNIGASDTDITVSTVDGIASADERSIMIELTDGTRFYRTISNVAAGATTADLTINASLGQAVTTSEINVICYLNRVAAASDTVEIQHVGNHLSSFSMAVSEVPA